MANAAEVLGRIKRVQQELDEINADLAARCEPPICDVSDIPLVIRFLEERIQASSDGMA